MSSRVGADDEVMPHVSRPLIGVLVATVALFALWIVALKPGGSSGGSPTQGLSGYKADINKAKQAVAISAAANGTAGGGAASSSPASTTAAATPPATAHATVTTATHAAVTHKVAITHGAAAVKRFSTVQHALRAHKALALLFYNPAAADDQAVKRELAAVATHRGKVVKLTIPLPELARYTAVTTQVPVNFSPTLVVIARSGKAGEIVGFSDKFEIAQRVDDALASR
jgi:hypothetical protein